MTNISNKHVTVLCDEAIEALALQSDSVVIDATLGSGGHTALILNILDEQGTLVSLDRDIQAVDVAQQIVGNVKATTHLVTRNFREIDAVASELNLKDVDAILADLGWRMEQFKEGEKGFSFCIDEPLLMTYGEPASYPFTAKDIVNEWREDDIKNVLRGYGEERFASRIANAIIVAREKMIIETSLQLVEIIKAAVPGFYRKGKIHPATRTFQALRIAVNDELDALSEFIEKSISLLTPGGHLVIISFHSLEDRIVKRAFRSYAQSGTGKVITKKPITASDKELRENPRARSAKLRIFEKQYEKKDNSII